MKSHSSFLSVPENHAILYRQNAIITIGGMESVTVTFSILVEVYIVE